ncbi:DUF6934 family protein [Dyadobacter chenhuakuii]|uniref:Uncharacterized protein n=1 Tax=Dyadobacter chenhuakuii TaxID=2909339 RepID=A0A9X1U2A1_9BACT|nr:hypothetical protein [Dyadobacter chenhuakuii]MCF2500321.1 hypothetical protein [Dyadobacter chenhuakuii]
MKHSKYVCKTEDSFWVFKFKSEGSKGLVQKIVLYTETGSENVYNLGFGDYDPETGSMNDISVTNNGDSAKILATVAATVYTFTEIHPAAWIMASGSTAARTRLYRMGITNNLSVISEHFAIFGYNCQGNWEYFVVGKTYEAFMITRKENDDTL